MAFDKDNNVVYVSTMPTLQNAPSWIPVGVGSANLSVNGVFMASPDLDNSFPAAPAGRVNVQWQSVGSQISGSVPSAMPGGSDTQVQFNNGGVFGGMSGFSYDKNTDTLTFPDDAFWDHFGIHDFKVVSVAGRTALTVSGEQPYTPNSNLVLVDGTYSGTSDFSGGAIFALTFGNTTTHAVSNTLGFDIAAINVGGGTLDGVIAIDFTPGGTNYTAINIEEGADPSQNTPIAAQGGISYFRDGFRLFDFTTGPTIKAGSGSPEGVVTAPIGSTWARTDGGLSSSFYVKESGTGNTGWKAGMVGSTDPASSLSGYLTNDAGIAAAQNAIVVRNINTGNNTKCKGLNIYFEHDGAQSNVNYDGLQVNVGFTVDAHTSVSQAHTDGAEILTYASGAGTAGQLNCLKLRWGAVAGVTVTNVQGILQYLPSIDNTSTITNFTGYSIDAPSGGGTITNFIGVAASTSLNNIINTNGIGLVTGLLSSTTVNGYGLVVTGVSGSSKRAGIVVEDTDTMASFIGHGLTTGIPSTIVQHDGWYSGTGAPEGVVTAAVGSFYSRRDGGANTTFYIKESGTGNTGWVSQLAASDLSNGTTGTLKVVLSDAPTFTTQITSPQYSFTGTDINFQEFGAGTFSTNFTAISDSESAGMSFVNGATEVMDLFYANLSFLTAAITSVQVSSNIVTVTCNNTFNLAGSATTVTGPGRIITISGLTGASFLNGASLQILTRSATQFTAAFTHSNYGPTADSGTATYQYDNINLRALSKPLSFVGYNGTGADPSFPLIMFGFGTGSQQIKNISDTLFGMSIGWDIGGPTTTTGGNWAPASGNGNFIALTVKPRINQTGTSSGNYTLLELAALEASVKGTDNYLLDCKTGPNAEALVSKFKVSNVGNVTQTQSKGETWVHGSATELLTLSTIGSTTDTVGFLLPANSIIESVVARVTTTITVATNWSLGDATTAARFASANATLIAGTTTVGLNHQQGSVSTDAAGPVQVTASKVRVTTTGTPGAGAIRITVFYRSFTAPTS